jgi:hypothetical protein
MIIMFLSDYGLAESRLGLAADDELRIRPA